MASVASQFASRPSAAQRAYLAAARQEVDETSRRLLATGLISAHELAQTEPAPFDAGSWDDETSADAHLWAWDFHVRTLAQFEQFVPYRTGVATPEQMRVLYRLLKMPIVVRAQSASAPALFVHPKSTDATETLLTLGGRAGALQREADAIAPSTPADHLAAHERDLKQRSMQAADADLYRTLWILTSPGRGLPYDLADPAPTALTVPDEVRAFDAETVAAIVWAWSDRLRAQRAAEVLIDAARARRGVPAHDWAYAALLERARRSTGFSITDLRRDWTMGALYTEELLRELPGPR